MELYNQIKAELLTQRKAYMKTKANVCQDKVKLLTTLVGDLDKKIKDDGEDLTDEKVIARVKSFLSSVEETLNAREGVNTLALLEKQVLQSFLPQQMEEAELREEITKIITDLNATSMKDMGKVMGTLKGKFDGKYDGTAASKIVKEML